MISPATSTRLFIHGILDVLSTDGSHTETNGAFEELTKEEGKTSTGVYGIL